VQNAFGGILSMKVVGRSVLKSLCAKHTDALSWIEHWLSEAEECTWSSPQDIKAKYSSASFLSGNRVIFNVKGNLYRLEVTVAYKTATVVVTWAGSHAEYDKRN
jgi:mRNA interferase HigB